jgi:hypothetical protein
MMGTLKGRLSQSVIKRLQQSSGTLAESARLAEYARGVVVPQPPVVPDTEPWLPASTIGSTGIDLREEDQLRRLDSWKSERHQRLFTRLRNNPGINIQRLGQSSLTNGWYNTPDAEIYAALILEFQPARIVEVGAGFSTHIARETIRETGLTTRITVSDPSPRKDVRDIADDLILQPVETSGLKDRDWRAGDLLFIDSSHICRTRGDIPYLFCELIPKLPPGVLVHVHDIYLPFDYPNNLDRLWYTEQYVLHALLSYSSRYRVVMTSHWLSRTHPERMRETLGSEVARDLRLFGGCCWFSVV